MRILIIEDEIKTAAYLRDGLKANGYIVISRTMEEKVVNLLGIPIIEQKNDDSYSLFVANKRKLIESLGDAIKKALPNNLYGKYQRLREEEKRILRNKIVNEYFKALKSSSENLKNLYTQTSRGAIDRAGCMFYDVEIFFPVEFTNKAYLSKMLANSLTMVQKVLIKSENEIYQFQNTSL